MIRLIGVGDNTIDTYTQSRVRYPGGNAVNIAVFAKRCGIVAAYLGSVGGDARGQLILDSLAAEGVDTSHCKVQKEIANAYVEVQIENGDRIFGHYDSGAAAHLSLTEDDLAYIQSFDVVHTSIYSFLENQAFALRRASRFLSVDFSSDLDQTETIARWLPLVDLAACSLSDHPGASVEEVAEDFVRQGAGMVLITRGADGSWVYDGFQLYHQEIIPAEVVDTMAAGDAYIASFLIGLMKKKTVSAAMRTAAGFAARACGQAGAFGYGQSYS